MPSSPEEHAPTGRERPVAPPARLEGSSLPALPAARRDVYARITDQIIADLERGVRPWARSWSAGHAAGPVSRPLRHDGQPYRGINVVMLWMSATAQGFSAPLWVTFRQCRELGGHVKPGSHSTLVVYANHVEKAETTKSGEESTREIWFMRGYNVFNVEQTEGLPGHYYAAAGPQLDPASRIEEAEAFFRHTKADIRHGGNSAHYDPERDVIQMPAFVSFRDPESYYATLGHETVHWTKHASRLDRDLGKSRFGDEGYAREELVAEIGSAFLCSDLGLAPLIREDHAAYVGHWLAVLKGDKRFIVQAASHAQKAVDYLHGLQPEKTEPPERPEVESRTTATEVVPEAPAPRVADAPPVVHPGPNPPTPPARVVGPEAARLLSVGVNPKAFLERFRAASRFAARKSPVPLLETVQLEVTPEGKGWLHAGHLDAWCSLALPLLKVTSPGAAQLSRDQVVKTLKDAKGGSVSFEALAEDGPATDAKTPGRKLAVRTPRASVTLATFDPWAFPRRTPESMTATVTLPAWRLSRALERTLYACDPDSARFALGGVSLEFAEGTLQAVATDGRCLALATEAATGSGLEAPKSLQVGEEERPLAAVVPLGALKGLVEALKTLDVNTKLTLGFTASGWFQLQAEGLSLSARLPEGRFPAWREVCPPASAWSAKVDPERLHRELKALGRFTTAEDRTMSLRLEGPKLTLSVANAEASTSAVVPVQNLSERPVEAAVVVLDPHYLLPYLAAQRGAFVLAFPPGEGWPLACESEGFRFLVMPMTRG